MSQLEELKRQRKELDAQIRALQAEKQEINCGDCTLRFYNKNYPQLNDKINLSVQRYGAFKRKSNKQTIFYVDTKEEAAGRIESLISDLQNILNKIR